MPECPDHKVEMVAREGRMVCPEAGCPRWEALPAGVTSEAGSPSPLQGQPPADDEQQESQGPE